MPQKILLVYDIAQQRDQMIDSLSEYSVSRADSYTEAYKLLLTKPKLDLIVCAAHLRDGSMFDLLKLVKSKPDTRQCSFLVVCFKPGQIARYFTDTVFSTARVLGAESTLFSVDFDEKEFKEAVARLLPSVTILDNSSQQVLRERAKAASAIIDKDFSGAELILRELHSAMLDKPASFLPLDIAIVQQELVELLEKSGKSDEAEIIRNVPCDF